MQFVYIKYDFVKIKFKLTIGKHVAIQNKRTGYKIQYCFEDIQSKKFKRV